MDSLVILKLKLQDNKNHSFTKFKLINGSKFEMKLNHKDEMNNFNV